MSGTRRGTGEALVGLELATRASSTTCNVRRGNERLTRCRPLVCRSDELKYIGPLRHSFFSLLFHLINVTTNFPFEGSRTPRSRQLLAGTDNAREKARKSRVAPPCPGHTHTRSQGLATARRVISRDEPPAVPRAVERPPRRRCGTRLPVRRPFDRGCLFGDLALSRGGAASHDRGGVQLRGFWREEDDRALRPMLQTASRRRRRRLGAGALPPWPRRGRARHARPARFRPVRQPRGHGRDHVREAGARRGARHENACAAAFVAASSSLAPRATCRAHQRGVSVRLNHLSPHAEPLLKLPQQRQRACRSLLRVGSSNERAWREIEARAREGAEPTAYSPLTRGGGGQRPTTRRRRHRRPRRPAEGGAAEGRAAPAARGFWRGAQRRPERTGPPPRGGGACCGAVAETKEATGTGPTNTTKEGTSACGRDLNLCATSTTSSRVRPSERSDVGERRRQDAEATKNQQHEHATRRRRVAARRANPIR